MTETDAERVSDDAVDVRHVDLDGLRVRYLTVGEGPPVVLLHGEQGRLGPAAWAVRAGTLIPDAEVRKLPGVATGHRESGRSA